MLFCNNDNFHNIPAIPSKEIRADTKSFMRCVPALGLGYRRRLDPEGGVLQVFPPPWGKKKASLALVFFYKTRNKTGDQAWCSKLKFRRKELKI